MTIDEMRLSPNARQGAVIVLERHPAIIFTSGRRDARDQARAMAHNTLRYGVGWLGDTYANQQMVKELEQWMEEHLDQTSSERLMAEGFYQTLMVSQAGQLSQFPHCRGDAFDIQIPRFVSGQVDEDETVRIKRTIETLPTSLGLQLILTREGAHRLIHAQFNHAVEAVST